MVLRRTLRKPSEVLDEMYTFSKLRRFEAGPSTGSVIDFASGNGEIYHQRVREVDRGTLTPLVLTAAGGMGPSVSIFFQKLTAIIAAKRGHTYQKDITWIRQRLTFSLLRSAISAIRATRFLPLPPPDPTMISILTIGGSGRHSRKKIKRQYNVSNDF